ncbi:MAG: Bacterial DNA-binding protein [Pelotomaculum sp. PtaU1.Bin065]|nr:MAG: Bacterial DNA-binding protein [Pelotomaculum sp. PtaU1.Bin065]
MRYEKINSPEVIDEIAQRMGCYKKDVANVLKHFSNLVKENAEAGKAVAYKEFGIFYPASSYARPWKKLKFRPAKKLAQALIEASQKRIE